WLLKDPEFFAAVQIVKDGGENNLHAHTNSNQMYFVLAGHVRFHGPGDTVIGDYGPNEGVFIPGGARYWFEKTGAEDLQLLQVVSIAGKSERIDCDPQKGWM